MNGLSSSCFFCCWSWYFINFISINSYNYIIYIYLFAYFSLSMSYCLLSSKSVPCVRGKLIRGSLSWLWIFWRLGLPISFWDLIICFNFLSTARIANILFLLAVSTSKYFFGINMIVNMQGVMPIAWTQNDQCQVVRAVITDVML